jgi:hypothetical protein
MQPCSSSCLGQVPSPQPPPPPRSDAMQTPTIMHHRAQRTTPPPRQRPAGPPPAPADQDKVSAPPAGRTAATRRTLSQARSPAGSAAISVRLSGALFAGQRVVGSLQRALVLRKPVCQLGTLHVEPCSQHGGAVLWFSSVLPAVMADAVTLMLAAGRTEASRVLSPCHLGWQRPHVLKRAVALDEPLPIGLTLVVVRGRGLL